MSHPSRPDLNRLPLVVPSPVPSTDIRVYPPPGVLGIAQVRLVDLVRGDDDDAEVGPRDGVLEVRDPLSQREALAHDGQRHGAAGRRVPERAAHQRAQVAEVRRDLAREAPVPLSAPSRGASRGGGRGGRPAHAALEQRHDLAALERALDVGRQHVRAPAHAPLHAGLARPL